MYQSIRSRRREEIDGGKGSCFVSFAPEFDRSSLMKTSGLPIKMLIEEEVSKKAQTRHSPPSVIARLMGLDTVPFSHLSHSQRKNVQRYVALAIICRRSTDELPELKDVFEVMESSELKACKNQKDRKGRVSSRHKETDVDFIRQKFMDAKRLSTDEQSSKEFDDAIEVLETNKDLLLDFLDEPNSLFTKHLHDLNCSPPPRQATSQF
ncbi:hypothetical protein ACMD2_17962 [Ananas comosus]|uniref:DUF3741 domain-containing protein n=1 Tax=Ananas comosus TaxID=4615 RepID=A0A199VA67_ANACO|nr:hypothetical protein ACMD2_17962 [Ananas comosus]